MWLDLLLLSAVLRFLLRKAKSRVEKMIERLGRAAGRRFFSIDGWVEADGAAEPDKDEAVGKP